MITYRITKVRQTAKLLMVSYQDADDPANLHEFHVPPETLECRMAEYGMKDPAAALDLRLHEVLWTQYAATLDPKDDPAVAAGWVTTENPDATAVSLFNALSGADAAGAHEARLNATREQYATITDPDGLLQDALSRPLDAGLIRHHRAQVDITRWDQVYGGLPARPRSVLPPTQQETPA